MIETEIITIIGNYGFPIAITIWFMVRTEKVINKNTDAFYKISEVMATCQKQRKR
jgi:hypothetical protein